MIDFGGHRLVERHFLGTGNSFADRRLFRHLRRCSRCREEYRIYASLEELAGDGEAHAQDRLARTIFRRRWRPGWQVGGLALAVACTAFVLWIGRGPAPFSPRGGVGDVTAQPVKAGLAIFRITAGGAGTRVGGAIRAGEPLAFSFWNPPPDSYCCLMVLARDGAGRVFWFWPSWQDAIENPTSLPIVPSREPIELRESVRHTFRPGLLTIVGLFSRHPYHVREVEAALANGVAGLATLDARAWSQTLEVTT